MKVRIHLLALILMTGQLIQAQSVEQGRKFFYYERYNSARDAFEKALASKPGNEEATYWLGQAFIELNNPAAARDIYQKSLAANGNSPLVLTGMGHVELLENKTTDARQRFETAISLSKGKDVNVLNAIGRANSDAPAGDAAYAIEKLNLATLQKGFKDPEVYINMGNAYRKVADGGGAITAYARALTLDPKYAAGRYYIGKVYQSQDNREFFIPAFEEAIQIDPDYAPAYRELYHYYYSRDVNRAIEYLDKYIAHTDQTPEIDYERTSVLFAARKYKEAIERAQSIQASKGSAADPKFNRLIAHSYASLGDSVNALAKIQEFIKTAPATIILPADYELEGDMEIKFPGQDSIAQLSYSKAISIDTSDASKARLADRISTMLEKKGNIKGAAEWKGKAYSFNKNPTKQDLFYAGYAFIRAQDYPMADSLFGIYSEKYPDEIYGHYWQGRAKLAMDTTGEDGKAVPHFLKFIEVAQKDSIANKAMLITAYGYLASYSNNVKKDKEGAIAYFDKILALDPNNADAKRFKEILQKQLNTAPPANGNGKPKPASGGK